MASGQSSGASDSTLRAAPLVCMRDFEPTAVASGLRCVCGPAHLKLRSEYGELVTPRGKAVNRCDYCARLAAVENCEMLALDAMQGDPPTGLIVLGTRTATVDMARFYDGLRATKRVLKRRWPLFEYACLVEFTTGYGERSGGLRRPHWNLATKGIPVEDLDAAGALAFPVWCRHVDAEVQAQHVTPIYAAEGLTRYLALHFQKASQQPPENFTGQRFNCSRGYFTGCSRSTARSRAREALALKREVWKQLQREDVDAPADAHEVELNAQLAYRLAARTRWVLASETGARLSDQALSSTTARDRLRRRNARQSARALARVSPDWLPHRETLFAPGAADVWPF